VGVRERATGRGRGSRRRRAVDVHGLGDPGSTTGDHWVGVVGVTSHNDGVVDRRLDVGARCCRWYTRGLREA
jgi:hypothetical protein